MKLLDVHYELLKGVPIFNGPLYDVWRKARGFDGGQRIPVNKLIHFAGSIYESSRDFCPHADEDTRRN